MMRLASFALVVPLASFVIASPLFGMAGSLVLEISIVLIVGLIGPSTGNGTVRAAPNLVGVCFRCVANWCPGLGTSPPSSPPEARRPAIGLVEPGPENLAPAASALYRQSQVALMP